MSEAKKSIMFFSNGNTAVIHDGKIMNEMNEPWILVYMEAMKAKHGEDMEEYEILMPNGRKAQVFEIENGWNWRFD